MADEINDEQRAQIEGETAREAANVMLDLMQGVPVSIAYNVIGNMTVSVFLAVPFVSPPDALEEYDRWAAYTREIIADQLKDRMQ